MTHIRFLDRLVTDVVEQYVRSRRPANPAVSTELAVRAIRTAIPNCELSNRELSDLVAASAIRNGRSVAFDIAE